MRETERRAGTGRQGSGRVGVARRRNGQAREARTNWLIAGTAVAAATTLILAIFTDSGGGAEPSVTATAAFQEDGVCAGLRGRF